MSVKISPEAKQYIKNFSERQLKKLADIIENTFNFSQINIDLCNYTFENTTISNDNICIFSVPCYGGRVPQTAIDSISKIQGDNTPAIVCVTFGNRAFEDALIELSDCVEANGFKVIAGCAIATEHNIMHIFGQGRPDSIDKQEITKFANKVALKLNSHDLNKAIIEGKHPYKDRHSSKTPIIVDKNTCINCGLCEQKCPVQAISQKGKYVDMDKCINCMRCIKICPQNCRSISGEFVNRLIEKLKNSCEARKNNSFYI